MCSLKRSLPKFTNGKPGWVTVQHKRSDYQIDRVVKMCLLKVGTWRGNSGPEISSTWTNHVLPIMRCIVCNLELCSRRWVYIAQIFFVFCSLIRKDWTHFILLLPKCNLPYMHCLYGKNPCNIQCKFIVKWFYTIVGSKGDQISKEILTFLRPSSQKVTQILFLLLKMNLT